MQETTAATPLLSAASKLASVEVKKVLRRVHVPQSKRDKKEALKPFGRMLGKIAAANPLSVAQTMIAQVHRHLRTRPLCYIAWVAARPASRHSRRGM